MIFLARLRRVPTQFSPGSGFREEEEVREKIPPLAWWNVDPGIWPGTRSLALLIQKLGRNVHNLKGTIMATKEEILAKVTAMHGELQSVAVALDELNGEFGDIKSKIDDLQRQIDEGKEVDLTELGAKVDEVAATVAGLMPAIKANP